VLVPLHEIDAILHAARPRGRDERSSIRGPRGQEPRVQRTDTWTNNNIDRSWVSIVPCKKGKAKWEARLHIYTGAGQPARELRRRSPHGSKIKSEQWGARLLRRLLDDYGVPRADATVDVEVACSRWLGIQASDLDNKRRHTSWLLQVWGAQTSIGDLTHEQIVGVPASLQKPVGPTAKPRSRKRRGVGNGRRRRKGTGLAAPTIRAICKTGNRVLAFAAKMGWCAEAEIPLPKVPVTDAEWFSVAELAALLGVAESPWRLAYLLGARTGLRRGEIVELRRKDIDLGRRTIRVRRAYKVVDGVGSVGPPKGGKPRTVPIPGDLAAELEKVEGRPHDLVVQTASGTRVGLAALSEQVARDAVRAGIGRPGVGAHTLRHTYCSHLALGGAPSVMIQAAAGHASLTTTQRYMHVAESDVAKAASFLPDVTSAGNSPETNDEDAE
jgi:integrase